MEYLKITLESMSSKHMNGKQTNERVTLERTLHITDVYVSKVKVNIIDGTNFTPDIVAKIHKAIPRTIKNVFNAGEEE